MCSTHFFMRNGIQTGVNRPSCREVSLDWVIIELNIHNISFIISLRLIGGRFSYNISLFFCSHELELGYFDSYNICVHKIITESVRRQEQSYDTLFRKCALPGGFLNSPMICKSLKSYGGSFLCGYSIIHIGEHCSWIHRVGALTHLK